MITTSSTGAPVELVVIIQSVSDGYSSSNKYSVDGEIAPTITLEKGKTYRFLQSDASNSNHPVRFSLTSNGTHNNGTEFSDNVSLVGQLPDQRDIVGKFGSVVVSAIGSQ